MAAPLSLDTITSSGSTITVPTGKILAIEDAGALKINDIAITTGALGTLSKTGAYDIQTTDYTGKSMLTVFVNVSAGTSTASDIKLPTAANFATCSINIVSTHAHGAGNSVVVKNNSGVEVYTLYHQGDHVEIQSDGTNVFRTGNEFATIRGEVVLTTGVAAAGSAVSDTWDVAGSSNYTVTQVGGGWSTTTDDFNAPHAGLYYFGGYYAGTTGQYNMGWNYHDGSDFITANSTRHAPNGVNTDGIMRSMAASDKNIWYGSNHSSATTALGAASGGDRCSVYFYMIRRY